MPKYSNVRELPSGRFQGRYVGPDGRGHVRTFERAREASCWVAEQQGDARDDAWINPSDSATPFGDWLAVYQGTRVDVRASTRARDSSYVRTHVLPTFGRRPVGAITQPDVSAWVGQLIQRGLAPSTVHAVYQVFRGVLQAAVDARLIRSSPCYGIRLPAQRREEMRFLTPSEIARLMTEMPERYQALVLVGCYAGLRVGELAGLDRRHVNPVKGRITVVQNAVEVRGILVMQSPKTQAGRRTVALPRTVTSALSGHLRSYTDPADDRPVFPGPDGARLRANNFRRRVWDPATQRAGLAGLRIHDMRHTAVALWIATGASALQVSRQAGHAQVAFTLQRYGHLYEDAADVLATGLDALVGDSLASAADAGGAPAVPLQEGSPAWLARRWHAEGMQTSAAPGTRR